MSPAKSAVSSHRESVSPVFLSYLALALGLLSSLFLLKDFHRIIFWCDGSLPSLSNNATANPQSDVPLSCRLSALLEVRDRLAGGMDLLQEGMDHLEVDMEGDGRGQSEM